MTEQSLPARVGDRLDAADEMVAVAESSTGGLVSSRLTDVPGSSTYFDRGVVSYSNAAKVDLLGVPSETLSTHGAVSDPTAREMARGVTRRSETTWGLATTGLAGPGGGTAEKPIGTVFVAVAHRKRETVTIDRSVRYEFDGDRLECKEAFTRQALSDLLDAITDTHAINRSE